MVPKPGTRKKMASGIGLALPEALQDRDARSWFKRFKVCAVANEWNDEKKLKRLPTLLKGRAWAIFDSLPDTCTDTYAHLKEALLSRLSPDTEEDRQSARDELGRRKLRENQESIDELARDIEKLFDSASPGLPDANRQAELRYHLLNALPEKITFQLKLMPQLSYHETISKARELLLLFHRTDTATAVNHLQTSHGEDRLRGVEEAIQQMSQQIASLNVRRQPSMANRMCFNCGQQGHLARNCRISQVECFNCGKRGHIARNCRVQGNGRGGPYPSRAGRGPRS